MCIHWLQIKILNSIITSILPGLALTVFLALLPMILTLLNRHVQKMISETEIDFGVVRKYFAFQVGIFTFFGLALQQMRPVPTEAVAVVVYCCHKQSLRSISLHKSRPAECQLSAGCRS